MVDAVRGRKCDGHVGGASGGCAGADSRRCGCRRRGLEGRIWCVGARARLGLGLGLTRAGGGGAAVVWCDGGAAIDVEESCMLMVLGAAWRSGVGSCEDCGLRLGGGG